MKSYETARIRNVALVGHRASGKTTLASALLYGAGGTPQLGSVPDGTSVTDFDEDEIERKFSMSVAVAFAEWNDCKINIVDAPGHSSFVGDSAAALRAADAALIVVDAVEGISITTERMWESAERLSMPVMFAVTRLDHERGEFSRVAEALAERFGRQVVPVTIPYGPSGAPAGVLRLATGKAYLADAGNPALQQLDPPDETRDALQSAQETLFDLITESDDELMEAYLEQGSLSGAKLAAGMRAAVASRTLFPVFATAAPGMVGAHALLDEIVDSFPTPSDRPAVKAKDDDGEELLLECDAAGPLTGQVVKTYIDPFAGRVSVLRIFSGTATLDQSVWNADAAHGEKLSNLSAPRGKTGEKIGEAHAGDIVLVTKLKDTLTGHTIVADKAHVTLLPPIPFPKPVIAYAVKADESSAEEKVTVALNRLGEEDSTLQVERDPRSHELMLSGLGISHVKMTLERMNRRYHVSATLEKPKVPYLETITKKAQAQYRHKKQSGGAGQFAEVHMRIEPLPRGAGFEYGSEIFGGSISRNFWPSIEKGVKQVLESGAVAGYPMVDVKAVIFDGKEHPVDSKDIAFQIAGRNVFRAAVQSAGPVVLEPVMSVVVNCPDDNMGDVLGDLNKRRGRVLGSEGQSGRTVINAEVPMAEMLEYSATLRSLTSGAGDYTMELDHYERVPADIQKQLMEQFKPHESED
jgi:elongation factor G